MDRLAAHVRSSLFVTMQHCMVGLALLYGLWVRVAVQAAEDWGRRCDRAVRDELDAMRAEKGLLPWHMHQDEEARRLLNRPAAVPVPVSQGDQFGQTSADST